MVMVMVAVVVDIWWIYTVVRVVLIYIVLIWIVPIRVQYVRIYASLVGLIRVISVHFFSVRIKVRLRAIVPVGALALIVVHWNPAQDGPCRLEEACCRQSELNWLKLNARK